MENKTNGMEDMGCKCATGSFKEKMISKFVDSKILQTFIDFIVGGKAITTDTDVVIEMNADFQGLEAVEKKEYTEDGRLTLSSQNFNGKCKVTFTIKGKGSYSLERK